MTSVRAFYDRFRHLIHEGARFVMVGLAGAIVTDSITNLLQYGAGIERFTALAIATVIGTAFGFLASRYWTFRHCHRTGASRETVAFVALNGIGIAITEGCVAVAVLLGLTGKLSYNLSLIGAFSLAGLFRYWSYKKWVWPPRRPVPLVLG